jgi:hypothetical protein
MIADFKTRVSKEKTLRKKKPEPTTLMPGDNRWDSAYAWTEDKKQRLVTQADLDAFRLGTQLPFVIVEISYTDNNVLHHLRTCQFLQPPAIPPGIWHYCDGKGARSRRRVGC